MLTQGSFLALVAAASRAPSADNLQPWAFRRHEDGIEVTVDAGRSFASDAMDMFSYVGVGAAVENIVVAASGRGLAASVECAEPRRTGGPVVVRLTTGGIDDPLAGWVEARTTNRRAYEAAPLDAGSIGRLTRSVRGLNAGVHWVTDPDALERLAVLEANTTCMRLEDRPLCDEVFRVLRLTQVEVERTRYGLDIESLELPSALTCAARLLGHGQTVRALARLGIGRILARGLASRVREAGAVCLVTARRQSPEGYVEAGRAMERLWLTATAEGLSAHPFGALPQYLTKVDVEPETLTSRHLAALRRHRGPFRALFPGARDEYPTIVLRIGRSLGPPSRRSVRLPVEQVILTG
jgi:nitroreductase